MYDTFTEWRNNIRSAEKALRLMKAAQASTTSVSGGCSWRSPLSQSVRMLEADIAREKALYAGIKDTK